ncbi:polysaccharide pyruvyl transferase family protein [Companilactobacillus zhongbaensis]|uniref:polysaccharide pyruvyl transferase family protein n=1 Tax=Companilactobacillus zhongbaensis TaxID=2486009 RepID=UPI000F7912A4|nr:polysaccharide pyruvyl transferase family protein [Companilactobacillus zhongbaensis]
MKIAISTLTGYGNYGNRLQNYALQHTLELMNNDVITIRNTTNSSETKLKKKIRQQFGYNSHLILFLKKFLSLFSHTRKLNYRRTVSFLNFTKKYINESDFEINERTNNFDFDKDVDCYVIGSDQVWNYSFPSFSEFDFVEYSNKPKISYAASFGVNDIPQNLSDFYRTGLEGIDYISVRETSGKKIVSSLIGDRAKVVLDPTLLLSKEDWQEISTKKPYLEKFIIVYFLDYISDDDFIYIQKYADANNYVIKRMSSREDEKLWESDPSEFINLFSQTEAVFTDSFHAVVFSIIFNKHFEVFERNFKGPSMNSRIDTLLGDLDLTDRWHSKTGNKKLIDYSKAMELLNNRKKESLSFLENSLRGVEKDING